MLLTDTMILTPTIVEDNKNGIMVIEGVFQLSDAKNSNGRSYPRKVWERIIESSESSAMKRLSERGMLGHLEHPKDGVTRISEVAHVVTSLLLDKDGRVLGRMELLDTPHGKVAQECVRKKLRIGVSSRGSGSVNQDGIVQDDYVLETFDLVYNPSVLVALPKVVKEGEDSAATLQQEASPAKTGSASPKTEKEPERVIVEERNMLDKFKAIEARVRPLIAQDPSELSEYQLSEVAEKMLEATVDLGKIAAESPAIAEATRGLVTALNEARAKVLSDCDAPKRKGKKVTPPPAEADETVEGDKEGEGEVDEAEEIAALKTLLSEAKTRIEEVESERDAAIQLSEGLVQNFEAKVEEAVSGLGEESEVSEELATRYDTALNLISELTSTKDDEFEVSATVESVIEQNPKLSPVRSLFEGCKSVAEVLERANAIVSVSGKPTITEEKDSSVPVGMIVESEEDIGTGKEEKPALNEDSSRAARLAHRMLERS